MTIRRLNRAAFALDRKTSPGSAAFTLIELLVVVAIVALLLAILLPSLAKAREQSRQAVCASNLKQLSNAVAMYLVDARNSLPGPMHAAVELETFEKIASKDYEEWHLPSFVRKYFTDKSTGGKSTDEVVKCPTALRISYNKLRNIFSRTEFERPFSYALNNWNAEQSSQIDFGTNPPWYFGYPDYFWQNTRPPFRRKALSAHALVKDSAPKDISVVKQPSREWSFGDAFRFEAGTMPRVTPGHPAGQWQRGTYQFEFVHTEGRDLIPRAPYHSGGINVAMFDAHVEWQRPWRGTVNPQ